MEESYVTYIFLKGVEWCFVDVEYILDFFSSFLRNVTYISNFHVFYQKFAQFRNCFSKAQWRRAISLIYFLKGVEWCFVDVEYFLEFCPGFLRNMTYISDFHVFIKNLLSLGIVSQRHHGGELYHLYIFEGSWMVFRWCGVFLEFCPRFLRNVTYISDFHVFLSKICSV